MEFQYKEPPINKKKAYFYLTLVGVGLFLIIFWSRISIVIPAGQAGVLFQTFGDGVKTDRTFNEGFHFLMPWNTMKTFEVRQQEASEEMVVLSSNGLEIKVHVSVWFQPTFDKLPLLYKVKGERYVTVVVHPAIRSATRSVIGRYTPDQLYSSKRDDIQKEIYIETKKILESQYVQVNEILVRDITLPPSIKSAIENKLREEQISLQYEFKLQQAEKEAQRLKIEAEGQARANMIIEKSITNKILKAKGIEATKQISESNNAKIIIIGGGKDGLPLILNGQ